MVEGLAVGPGLVGAWEHLRSVGVVRISLQPQPIRPVPEETARIAHAAFPRGTPWIRLRDELGSLFGDAQFAALFSPRGRPAEAPWRLALVTVMQFAEQLSDRKAADALRGRIGWIYALGLSLDDPGFDASVWCEFRAYLIAGLAEVLQLRPPTGLRQMKEDLSVISN